MVKKFFIIYLSVTIFLLGFLWYHRNHPAESVSAAVASSPASTENLSTPSPTATTKPIRTAIPYDASDMPTQFDYYAPTTHMSFEELVGDNGIYSSPKGYPSADTYKVIVDIAHQVVMIYKKDLEGNYTLSVRYMLCSTGEDDSTPIGTFKLKKYRVRFGYFGEFNAYAQYWTLIDGAIYFHSILYNKRDANEYVAETYDALGTIASHGCVRLTVPDARFIYYNLAHGTEIEIRQGDLNDMETAAIRAQLQLAECPKERVILKRGEIPNTDNWSIEEIPNEVPYEIGSQLENQ